MSPVDIATGHVRRYTKRTMRKALTAAGLEVVEVRYANSLGLVCYYAFTSLLKKQPSTGGTMSFYDRLVVPVVRLLERWSATTRRSGSRWWRWPGSRKSDRPVAAE